MGEIYSQCITFKCLQLSVRLIHVYMEAPVKILLMDIDVTVPLDLVETTARTSLISAWGKIAMVEGALSI